MILSHRIWHHWMLTVLTVLLALMAVAALQKRPLKPISKSSVKPLYETLGFGNSNTSDLHPIGQHVANVADTSVRMNLLSSKDGIYLLVLTPSTELKTTDPLVYWQAEDDKSTNLNKAKLIGSLAGSGRRSWWLHPSMNKGSVLIVSPGIATPMAAMPLPKAGEQEDQS